MSRKSYTESEFYWLEVLEALVDLLKRYPDDLFVNERVQTISGNLGHYLDVAPGNIAFFELWEGYDPTEADSNHYTAVINSQLERLAAIRRERTAEEARYDKEKKKWEEDFAQIGYTVVANYADVSQDQPAHGATLLVSVTKTGRGKIETGVPEIRTAVTSALRGFSFKTNPSQAKMQSLADKLPTTIDRYALQTVRVIHSKDWLHEGQKTNS